VTKFKLSEKSIARFVSIKKEKDVVGLVELAKEMSKPIQYFEKEER
jgi:cobalt-precorrin 5A hydrolase